MIFNELYSAYYNAVAKIIAAILDGCHEEKELRRIVEEQAFGESMLTILPSLKSGKWQLTHPDWTTPLTHRPTMPLTTLQKRWLKAISLDVRIRLFGVTFDGLDDVEPLFTPDDYVVYDQYADGDPYFDEGYVQRFRTVMTALRNQQPLRLEMVNRKGNVIRMTLLPTRMEYSEKDDKFRLIGRGNRYGGVVNLARMISCELVDEVPYSLTADQPAEWCTVTLRVRDDRNALERCLMHFAHFEKRAERQDDRHYLVHIRYDQSDETEMVIRTLSFGPLVEAVEPAAFRERIIDRLQRQKSCELV